MREYVKNGASPEFALWNPGDLGYLSDLRAQCPATGKIKGGQAISSPPAALANTPSRTIPTWVSTFCLACRFIYNKNIDNFNFLTRGPISTGPDSIVTSVIGGIIAGCRSDIKILERLRAAIIYNKQTAGEPIIPKDKFMNSSNEAQIQKAYSDRAGAIFCFRCGYRCCCLPP